MERFRKILGKFTKHIVVVMVLAAIIPILLFALIYSQGGDVQGLIESLKNSPDDDCNVEADPYNLIVDGLQLMVDIAQFIVRLWNEYDLQNLSHTVLPCEISVILPIHINNFNPLTYSAQKIFPVFSLAPFV